jgi:hypothetical protein
MVGSIVIHEHKMKEVTPLFTEQREATSFLTARDVTQSKDEASTRDSAPDVNRVNYWNTPGIGIP